MDGDDGYDIEEEEEEECDDSDCASDGGDGGEEAKPEAQLTEAQLAAQLGINDEPMECDEDDDREAQVDP